MGEIYNVILRAADYIGESAKKDAEDVLIKNFEQLNNEFVNIHEMLTPFPFRHKDTLNLVTKDNPNNRLGYTYVDTLVQDVYVNHESARAADIHNWQPIVAWKHAERIMLDLAKAAQKVFGLKNVNELMGKYSIERREVDRYDNTSSLLKTLQEVLTQEKYWAKRGVFE